MTLHTKVDQMSPVGPQVLELDHVQSRTVMSVEFSTDDGDTWRTATVIRIDGKAKAYFAVRSPGFVSLRVTATDTAGGDTSATTVWAYEVM